MIQSKAEYLRTLQAQLKKGPETDDIIQEFDMIITDMLAELQETKGVHEKEAMNEIARTIGSPDQVAAMYMQELGITPVRTQWTFIFVNVLFFVAGIFLTLFYHVLPIPFIERIWHFLTSISGIIMLLYMVFWGLVGYEIGKEFGFNGKPLLAKTFYAALIPNLVLMGLVVFRIIPFSWFDPLLTPSFIGACIGGTILLYPISYTAFRWGIAQSV